LKFIFVAPVLGSPEFGPQYKYYDVDIGEVSETSLQDAVARIVKETD
jgi:hypothetical protein